MLESHRYASPEGFGNFANAHRLGHIVEEGSNGLIAYSHAWFSDRGFEGAGAPSRPWLGFALALPLTSPLTSVTHLLAKGVARRGP